MLNLRWVLLVSVFVLACGGGSKEQPAISNTSNQVSPTAGDPLAAAEAMAPDCEPAELCSDPSGVVAPDEDWDDGGGRIVASVCGPGPWTRDGGDCLNFHFVRDYATDDSVGIGCYERLMQVSSVYFEEPSGLDRHYFGVGFNVDGFAPGSQVPGNVRVSTSYLLVDPPQRDSDVSESNLRKGTCELEINDDGKTGTLRCSDMVAGDGTTGYTVSMRFECFEVAP